MPSRILKETVNESRGLSEASPFAQDLFKRLITYADDYGRFNGDTQIMRARLYPRELDSVLEVDVEDGIIELVGVGKARLYTAPASSFQTRGSVVFGYFPNWHSHQRLRESKAKFPDPELHEVNDWALRRFVPIAMKREILERDGFSCQECGVNHALPGIPIERAARLLSSVLHFDHIVTVLQGGRATLENLRVLCASCNLRRPKVATLEEMARMATESSKPAQLAATRGENLLARAPTGAGAGSENPKGRGAGRFTPPKPPPQAGGGEVTGVTTVTLNPADVAAWRSALDRIKPDVTAGNFQQVALLEPLGRAPDGGLRLRAPPGVRLKKFRAVIARALLDAGDRAAGNVAIVEG